jgi:hypothetical protein
VPTEKPGVLVRHPAHDGVTGIIDARPPARSAFGGILNLTNVG